ncbi:MAG: KUP/HAK/KT family potassium transporter [Thermoleophilia bacterium]|nr:KUP/HAK/KT family potassium transporter [Thermoleophilia bacterium]
MKSSHQGSTTPGSHVPQGRLVLLAFGAIGIIYGDIGTSPLYAFQAAFNDVFGLSTNREEVLGLLSLFIWTLVLVVTVKYIVVIMRADNEGEGGTLALGVLALRYVQQRHRVVVIAISMLAISLFAADGILTPSISVLSAIEGLSMVMPGVSSFEDDIALAILAVLFLAQRFGTGKIGHVFGPIMVLWFAAIAALGVRAIIGNPEVLAAINPLYAAELVVRHPLLTFVLLGAVTLAITGVEALYADMGHFGRRPIAASWLVVVLPALTLCYLGQGALVLENPSAATNSFYLLVPSQLLVPMIVLATLATIIASQAVISGMFTVAQQAMRLGWIPRMRVLHTSKTVRGQITVPIVTLLMFLGVAGTVLNFETSARLANAYGLTVTGTLLCTTLLAVVVARHQWQWPVWRIVAIFVPMAIIDVAFFSANLAKIVHGAWFTLLIAALLLLLIQAWTRSRDKALAAIEQMSLDVPAYLQLVERTGPARTIGTGVHLASRVDRVPRTLAATCAVLETVFEQTIMITVETANTPLVAEQTQVEEVAPGIWHIVFRHGFAEAADIPRALSESALGSQIDPLTTTYFVGRDSINVVSKGLAKIPLRLFAMLHQHSQGATEFFGMPSSRTITIGARIDL